MYYIITYCVDEQEHPALHSSASFRFFVCSLFLKIAVTGSMQSWETVAELLSGATMNESLRNRRDEGFVAIPIKSHVPSSSSSSSSQGS